MVRCGICECWEGGHDIYMAVATRNALKLLLLLASWNMRIDAGLQSYSGQTEDESHGEGGINARL